VTPISTTPVRRAHSAFDRCVLGALSFHLLSNTLALGIAINLSMVWLYLLLRALEAPLVLVVLLIYTRARRR
jgi:hypothetical protein